MEKYNLYSQRYLTAEGHYLMLEVERDYKYGYINYDTYKMMIKEIGDTYIELSDKIYRAILRANSCPRERRQIQWR